MIELNKKSTIIELKNKQKNKEESVANPNQKRQSSSASRPKVVDAKVYKVKSAFVKNSVFITLSYVETEIEEILTSKKFENIDL